MLKNPVPEAYTIKSEDLWSVLDDIKYLGLCTDSDPDPDFTQVSKTIKSARKKLCKACGISESEFNKRFDTGDLPF